jgi:hypothetical protein
MVGQHLFLNKIPNNLTVVIRQKHCCDWGMHIVHYVLLN